MGKKPVGQVASGRSRAYERLTPESAVLLLVDHQSGLMSGVRDLAPDEVRHNVIAFARAARVLHVPVVLTSTAPMMWGPPCLSSRRYCRGWTTTADRGHHDARVPGVSRHVRRCGRL